MGQKTQIPPLLFEFHCRQNSIASRFVSRIPVLMIFRSASLITYNRHGLLGALRMIARLPLCVDNSLAVFLACSHPWISTVRWLPCWSM
jgi:hypothetical protein